MAAPVAKRGEEQVRRGRTTVFLERVEACMCATESTTSETGRNGAEMLALAAISLQALQRMIYPGVDIKNSTEGAEETAWMFHDLVKLRQSVEPNRVYSSDEVALLTNYNPAKIEEKREKLVRRARLAGAVFFNVWRMDMNGHAGSVNKGVAFTHKATGKSMRTVWSAWMAHKDVSHLCAAHYLLHVSGRGVDPDMVKGEPTEELCNQLAAKLDKATEFFLQSALLFYDYATGKTGQTHRGVTLDPVTTWIFSREEGATLPQLNISSPFRPDELKILAEYKARQP